MPIRSTMMDVPLSLNHLLERAGQIFGGNVACIVLKSGHNAAPDALAAHLLQRGFAKWQLPDRYELIAAVPRTSTGKFWKLKLRERFPR